MRLPPSRLVAARIGTLAALCLAVIPALGAQERPATIRGTISAADSHAPVSGARVSIANPARATYANEKGAFVLRDIPAGAYDLTVTAVGHEPSHTRVTVKGGDAQTVDVSLKAGSLMLSSMVISATRTPTDASQVAATVNLLAPEQVRTSPARETQDLLREIPGVEMPRTSSIVGGTAQIVSIRGVDEGRTAVLLDGIPLNDAWGEWIDWGRAPKSSIDRVEVLEGGGSSLYGNGAMGGVISLYSRPISPGSYDLTVDGGDRNARHSYASVGVPLGNAFSLGLSGDYSAGGGYTLTSPATGGPVDVASQIISRNATARVEYAPSANISAFVSGHLFSDDRHLGTPLTQAIRSDGATTAGLNIGNGASGLLTVRGWDREMREDDIGTTINTTNGVARASERITSNAKIPSYDRGVGVTWTRDNLWGFQSLGVGGDYRYLGGYFDEQDYANTAANGATTHLNSGGNQSLSGVFVNGVLAPAKDWRVELSARVDSWGNNDGVATDASGTTTFPNATRNALSPRIGVRYQVLSTLSMHVAAYQAFRAPNLAELYRKQVSATTISIPNPALEPEFATGYEFGLDWQPERWIQFKATIYQANYRDFNTFVTTSAAGVTPSTRTRENVQNSRSLGGEVYLALRPLDGLTLSGSLNYDDDRILSLGPVPQTATTFVGARIGRVPIQKATARASYDSNILGTWTLLGRYEGSNTTLGNSFTLPEFGVVDGSVHKTIIPGLAVFMTVENIFNRQYYVNLSGASAAPIISLGLPRTWRLGMEAYRF